MEEKLCENRRNCLLQAISPFLTMISTAIYLKCVKMRHCVVMGQQACDSLNVTQTMKSACK